MARARSEQLQDDVSTNEGVRSSLLLVPLRSPREMGCVFDSEVLMGATVWGSCLLHGHLVSLETG